MKHPRDRMINRLRERVVRAACAAKGHTDFGCYSVTGLIGDRCNRCGRIQWQSRTGWDAFMYQEPTFPTLYRSGRGPFKGWWK